MSKNFWIASLVAVLVGASAGVAHAETPKANAAQRGNAVSTTALPTVRQQIRATAAAAGLWNKGTSLRIKYNEARTQASASLWNRSLYGGPPTKFPTPTRVMTSAATFKVKQAMEGKIAVPVKQYGQVWQPVMRPLNTKPNW